MKTIYLVCGVSGADKLTWEVVRANLSFKEAVSFELQTIKDLGSHDAEKGYNLLYSSSGWDGKAAHSPKSIKQISDKTAVASKKSWDNNKERKQKASASTGQSWSDKLVRTKRTQRIKEVRGSSEQRLISSLDGTKRYSDPVKRDEMATACGAKPFMVFDKVGNKVGEWTNAAQCAKDLKLTAKNHISNCLHGRLQTYLGYRFVFSETINKTEELINET
jgi:hypothetical protein